jgi:hypothetical protein
MFSVHGILSEARLGMKTVEKTLMMILILFYNNSTKMLRTVHWIKITDHSKMKNLKQKYVKKQPMNLSQ